MLLKTEAPKNVILPNYGINPSASNVEYGDALILNFHTWQYIGTLRRNGEWGYPQLGTLSVKSLSSVVPHGRDMVNNQ